MYGFTSGNMFDNMPVFLKVFFLFIIGCIICIIVKGIAQWSKNNNSPEVTRNATVVAKRTEVWGDSASTHYYVTFQFENGERLELPVKGSEYGMLAESDHGRLSHQGTRYRGFERD